MLLILNQYAFILKWQFIDWWFWCAIFKMLWGFKHFGWIIKKLILKLDFLLKLRAFPRVNRS